MPAHYMVVQYVPDPVVDERINVGVIVFGDGQIRSEFLRNWQRVKQFGTGDLTFLKDFAQQVGSAQSPARSLPEPLGQGRLDEDSLVELAGHWHNSIQFTQPKASLRQPDELLADVAARFLRQPARVRRTFRDKRAAVRLASKHLKSALVEQVGPSADSLLKPHYFVSGEFEAHHFDLGVANGTLLLAAEGLSFEVPDRADLEQDVIASKWAVRDVRGKDPDVPLAIVALPPSGTSKTYDNARRIFEQLHTQVIVEDEVASWASREAARIAALSSTTRTSAP